MSKSKRLFTTSAVVLAMATPTISAISPVLAEEGATSVSATGDTTADKLQKATDERDLAHKEFVDASVEFTLAKGVKSSSDAYKSNAEKALADAEKVTSDAEAGLKDASEKISEARKTITEQTSVVEKAENRIENLKNVKELATKKLDVAKKVKADADKKIEDAKAVIAEQKSLIESKKAEVEKAKESKTEPTADIKQFKKLLAAAQADLKAATRGTDAYDQASGNVKTFTTAIEQAQAKIDAADKIIEDANTAVKTANSTIATQEKIVTAQTTVSNEQKAIISEQEKAIKDNDDLIKEQNDKIADAKSKLSKAQETIESYTAKKADFDQIVKNNALVIAQAQANLKSATDLAKSSQARYDAAETRLEKAEKDLQVKQATVDALRAQSVKDQVTTGSSTSTSTSSSTTTVSDVDSSNTGTTTDASSNTTSSSAASTTTTSSGVTTVTGTNVSATRLIKITLKHVDTNGNEIAKDTTVELRDDSDFTLALTEIEGYQYFSGAFLGSDNSVVEVPKSGFKPTQDGVVTIVYKADEKPVDTSQTNGTTTSSSSDDTTQSSTNTTTSSTGDNGSTGATTTASSDQSTTSTTTSSSNRPPRGQSVSGSGSTTQTQATTGQTTADGIVTDILFSKGSAGENVISGKVDKSKLASDQKLEGDFAKVVVTKGDGTELASIDLDSEYGFKGVLKEEPKEGDKLIVKYGGKNYEVEYTLKSTTTSQQSTQSADTKTQSQGQNSSTPTGSGNQTSSSTSRSAKSTLLPSTGQKNVIGMTVAGVSMMLAGIVAFVLKFRKKSTEE